MSRKHVCTAFIICICCGMYLWAGSHQKTVGCIQAEAAQHVPGVPDSCWSPDSRLNTPGKYNNTQQNEKRICRNLKLTIINFTNRGWSQHRTDYGVLQMCHYCILYNTVCIWCDPVEMYLFDICRPKGQIVQAVRGHIPNSIKEPGVSDRFHTQLPTQEMRRVHFYNCFYFHHQLLWQLYWILASPGQAVDGSYIGVINI